MKKQPTRSDQHPLLKGFGDAVRNRRVKRGLTQEELGGKAGLHRTYVSDIESGLRNLSFLTMARVAIALGQPLAKLIHAAEKFQ